MTFRLQLAWRYLWGRKWRTALTTLAIVLGVMIIFGMNGLAPVMKASLDESIAASAHQVDLIVTHKTGGIFDQSLADVVRRTPGVAVVAPALNLPVLLPPGYTLQPVSGGRPVDRLGVNGWEPAAALKATPLNPVAGRWLAPEDANAIVVRESLAQKTGLTLGDSLQLPSAGGVTRFEVVGILPASPVLGEEKVYITLAAAQRLFNRPGQINGLGAQFEAGQNGDAVRRAVLARLGPDFEGGDVSAGGNEWESFFRMVNLMTTTLGLLALAMGGFIMFITFRTAVTERKQDAGMLRAVGASRRAVTGLVLTEGIIQGTAGTAAGLLAGYLLAKMLVRLFDPIWDEIMHTSLGDPVFTPQTVALAIGFGLGVPLIGVWLPALSAGRVTPLEALRPAVGVVERQLWGWQTGLGAGLIVLALAGAASGRERLISAGALVFLIGLAVTGPALVRPASTVLGRLLEPVFAAEGHLARGNLARRPGRAAITALTIAISLAILITLAGFSTTMGKGMTNWLETSMGANYLLLPQNLLLGRGNVEAGPELAQGVRRTPGIAAVTTLRRSETQFNGAALQVIGIDPETYPEVSGLAFSAGEPEQAYIKLAQGRYLVANGIFAAA
ncbi:MAG: ABC transporter permease, partial [Anaerolineae bacterium]